MVSLSPIFQRFFGGEEGCAGQLGLVVSSCSCAKRHSSGTNPKTLFRAQGAWLLQR